MKRRQYYKRAVKRHYGGELRGLAHNQLFAQRGLRGITLGPANRGRRLDAAGASADNSAVDFFARQARDAHGDMVRRRSRLIRIPNTMACCKC
jgi:hypothetical protein